MKKETIIAFLKGAIPSWNPENFGDLQRLLELQYPEWMPEIKKNLGITDNPPSALQSR